MTENLCALCARPQTWDNRTVTTPAEPQITVQKVGYYVPVVVLGTDEQGRTLVRCPSPGCGDPAYVAEDGRVVCQQAEAEAAFLRRAMEKLLP